MRSAQGVRFTREVTSVKPKKSPLIQEGFESIPMTIVVMWGNSGSLQIFKKKTEEVTFSVENDYVDDSKSRDLRFPSLRAAVNHKHC